SLLVGYACDSDDDDDESTPAPVGQSQMTPGLSLAGTVVADPRFSTLKAALEKADLVSVLEKGEYTVFAPTNEAFAKIPAEALNALLNDKAALTRVLLYHVVPGTLKADKVLASKDLLTANEFGLKVAANKDGAFINSSRIINTDIVANNGVIHAIDTVLLPPATDKSLVDIVVEDARFSTLKTAVVTAGLVDTLKKGPYTIFAPTNEAFAELGQATLTAVLADKAKLTSILLYHVVPGAVPAEDVLASASLTTASANLLLASELKSGEAYINNAKILQTDIQAKNGVIHVINKVLLPPAP
ncbi:MAG: fasciclin domain-containing protein, partial [Pseudobdellovibrionaceae bacterium]|nr:fasciclin domain-containing protein [Pseudobdellovibrionaceae bacterium]